MFRACCWSGIDSFEVLLAFESGWKNALVCSHSISTRCIDLPINTCHNYDPQQHSMSEQFVEQTLERWMSYDPVFETDIWKADGKSWPVSTWASYSKAAGQVRRKRQNSLCRIWAWPWALLAGMVSIPGRRQLFLMTLVTRGCCLVSCSLSLAGEHGKCLDHFLLYEPQASLWCVSSMFPVSCCVDAVTDISRQKWWWMGNCSPIANKTGKNDQNSYG